MSAIQTPEERIDELLRLRARVDAEIARVRQIAKRRPRMRRARGEKPECGTEAGYQWHRYRGQKCDACRVAHNAHTRQRARTRKSA